MLLLKALKITQDPKQLKEMIGVRTVAEVYRTLDKLAMRKEYHEALSREGISFDYIIQGIKQEAESGDKSSDRLKAFQILLKSLGMEKYEDTQIAGGSWEDELLRIDAAKNEDNAVVDIAPADYDVITPVLPESVRIIKEKEKKEGQSLYE